MLWTLIAKLFSSLCYVCCQPLPFTCGAGTAPIWGFLDTVTFAGTSPVWGSLDTLTFISFLAPPIFQLLSLTEMPFSKDPLCPTSPNCRRQPVSKKNQIIKCLKHFCRFFCFKSHFKSSFFAFRIGGLLKYLHAKKPDCKDITSLQTLPCLCLDYHSYNTTLNCTVKALFYQMHPIL